MIKFLFFDYRDYEIVKGFERKLGPPRKHSESPFLVSDDPAEGNVITMYGSVLRRPDDGLWQMWYTVRNDLGLCLAYAESQDGLEWSRPKLDVIRYKGKKTHLVFDAAPHGATVMYDPKEERPEWKYKMLCGARPSNRISGFRSPDGVHWSPLPRNPVTGSNPDSPMSLHRADDGRYVAYHRPNFGDRRVGRSESWDFLQWSEPKLVMEPDAADPPQMQFYGLGSIPYGAYEVGTLWIYQTFTDDMDFYKMKGHQQPELAYARSGYSWHRAAQGTPLIRRGPKGSWDWGMVQCASSPVLLEEEIRFYYAAFRVAHPWGGSDGKIRERCGIGMARMKPDRFVSLSTGSRPATLLTRPFWTDCPEFYLNASTSKGGAVKAEITELDGRAIRGFSFKESVAFNGNAIRHRLAWNSQSDPSKLAHRQIRLRIRATDARLYSVASGTEDEIRTYWKFRIPFYLNMESEKRMG